MMLTTTLLEFFVDTLTKSILPPFSLLYNISITYIFLTINRLYNLKFLVYNYNCVSGCGAVR